MLLDADVGSRDQKKIRCATYGDIEAALYKWLVDVLLKNILHPAQWTLHAGERQGFKLCSRL